MPTRRRPPAAASTLPAPRGADELDFLGTRAKSTPMSRAGASATVRTFFHDRSTADANAGAQAHDDGTQLNTMYMGHVDAVLGFPTWEAFLDAYWPDDPSTARDRQRLAKLLTRADASEYGLSRSLYGLQLMKHLKVESFAELKKRTLRLHAADGGGTTKFPASSQALRSVIRRLVAVASTQPSADEASTGELGETNRLVRAVCADDPEVAAIKPVAWADAAGVHVRVTASGARGSAAAIRLFRRLEKLQTRE